MTLSKKEFEEECIELFNDLTYFNNLQLLDLAKKHSNQIATNIDASALLKLTCIIWARVGLSTNKTPKEILEMFRQEFKAAWYHVKNNKIDPELN